MTKNKLFLAAGLGLAGFVTGSLVSSHVSYAQSATTGAIQGQVKDEKGEPIVGVTVIVTSPSLSQTQSAITDENGYYKVSDLPPGDYLVTFYYEKITLERSGIHVGIEKSVPVFQQLNTAEGANETIHVVGKTPTIDPTSTTQGITLDKNYIKNIPVPGRTFEAALGAAAGSQNDGLGTSFSGSSSLENQYYVDGVNTTGLTFGTVGSPVINDFIEEIEVITGGYNAEYGRATGGVVNVVTKSGSNELKGSVFGYWQPGQLTAATKSSPINASSIDVTPDLAYNADFGFELGGPIIKDKLWFYVGFAPQFAAVDYYRDTKSLTDCRITNSDGTLSDCKPGPKAQGGFANGAPDVDPKTGFFITDPLDEEIRTATSVGYNILGKINYAATPENQGQLTIQALPGSARSPNLFGPVDQAFATQGKQLTTDISAKWTSKFNDNKTEVEAVIGWHRDHVQTNPFTLAASQNPLEILEDGNSPTANLGVWGPGFGAESAATNAGCQDGGGGDKYANIVNCPMVSRAYAVGGFGSPRDDIEDRKSIKLSVTERVKAAGSHEIKAGFDIENNTSDKSRYFTGGAQIINDVSGSDIEVQRWVQLGLPMDTNDLDPNTHMPRFDNTCSTPNTQSNDPQAPPLVFSPSSASGSCDFLQGDPNYPGTRVVGNTFNWAAYVRDSWQIKPNITLNVGLRYEEERLRYADFLQNRTDPLTGNFLGKNAMTLQGMLAPRIGILYDPTKEGRSKIYAHWGRFYESIPMDINDRSFGGEVLYDQLFSASQCADPNKNGGKPVNDPRIGGVEGTTCLLQPDAVAGNGQQLIGASGVLVAPGIKAQYMDEILAGLEYEILDDLKIGISYQNRQLQRVIEDVSTDGANTYIISNPGEWDKSDEDALMARIAAVDDPKEKARLQHQLQLFQGIRIFDKPTRDYNALQFTLTRRFSKKLYVQASYTYSRTEGNYPGLVSYDNGQVDPNISSQFDLIELLSNHVGPLQTDRPHYIKVDGYYTFDFGKNGNLTTGIRFRALSGIPENALAPHYLYGVDESFLLPRGELGRTDFDHGLDLHVGYGKPFTLGKHNYQLELFFDVYNVYDRQGTFYVDNTYAPFFKEPGPTGAPCENCGSRQSANPVSGGTYEDLIWVKQITVDRAGNPTETSAPIGRNPNFHNTTERYGPAYGRIGVRLTF